MAFPLGALAFFCLATGLGAQTINSSALRRCIGALNAFESEIRQSRSELSPDWVRATVGGLLIDRSMSREAEDDLVRYNGDIRDISLCSQLGVSPAAIQTFTFAFHGYLPSDPIESLSMCYAAFAMEATDLERALGAERAYSYGVVLGRMVGSTLVQLGYLYPDRKRTLQYVEQRAEMLQASASGKAAPQRRATTEAYLSHCGFFGIPVAAVLQGAGVAPS